MSDVCSKCYILRPICWTIAERYLLQIPSAAIGAPIAAVVKVGHLNMLVHKYFEVCNSYIYPPLSSFLAYIENNWVLKSFFTYWKQHMMRPFLHYSSILSIATYSNGSCLLNKGGTFSLQLKSLFISEDLIQAWMFWGGGGGWWG